ELAQLREEMKDEMIQKSVGNIVYVINEIRQLSRSLMNPSIGDLGLLAATRDLISNINSTRKLLVKLEANNAIEAFLTSDSKLVFYQILHEALNNAIKHSGATNVLICIKKNKNNLELVVQDDGIGFNIAEVKKGIGLKNIENRVYLINGQMQIKTAPGKGCTLIVHFPFKKIKTNPQ
ncbi:MAG: sensor histidine kinase, partial [Chitinophagaceae bacterium]